MQTVLTCRLFATVLLLVNCLQDAGTVTVEDEKLGELARQVADTNKALEELLATKLRDIHYATVIGELRAEIDALRRDMVHLKESGASTEHPESPATAAENEQKTIKWLQSSLTEMRSEIGELNRAVNVSLQMQEEREAAGQLQLIRSDVTALQASTGDAAAHRRQLNQSIQEAEEGFRRLDRQQQINTAQLERLENNMADLRLDVQLSRQMLAENHYEHEPVVVGLRTKKNERKTRSVSNEQQSEEDDEDSNEVTTERGAHRRRLHRQDLKHEVQTLRKMVKTLANEQHDLQRQMVLLSQLRMTAESNVHKMEEELRAVLKKLEAQPVKCAASDDVAQLTIQNKRLSDSVDKLSAKVTGVDQVQSSTLQLFEAIERLEERYDESIGELQKEVSKLDFNDGQLMADVHTLREDQNGQSDAVKALRSTAALLQEQVQADQVRAALLMAKLTNNTLAVMNQQQVQVYPIDRLHGEDQQSVDSLRQSLATLENQYNTLTHNLPHDCREVSGTGVNYILPRESSEVIKVYCDQEISGGGWTVVQRRTDGKEDFNRNWAAYKSGFGSVHGEFWLGNDHLHQLTKDNTTMLRVDLWDIYGQYWWAEYDSFTVDSENDGYALQLHGYTGNASDAMASYHQSMRFSTRDNDQDLSNTNCADSYQGGWWYSHCQHVNINGKYALGLTWYDSLENEWIALSKVEMKVRDKRIFSTPPTTTTTTTTTETGH